jgi:MYXO-CTERM domain-containing protein
MWLTACTEAEFETMPPTATSDRVCVPLGNCAEDEYESAPETGTTDRVCEPFTVCGAAQYQSAAPTATRDRICEELRTCAASEFESSPPTAIEDRECTQCTVCDGVIEVTACSQAADTVCGSAMTGDSDAGIDGSVVGMPRVAGGGGCSVSGTAPASHRSAFGWIPLLALVTLVAVRRRQRRSRCSSA